MVSRILSSSLFYHLFLKIVNFVSYLQSLTALYLIIFTYCWGLISTAYAEFNIFPLEKLPLYLSNLIAVCLRNTFSSEAIVSSLVLVTYMV